MVKVIKASWILIGLLLLALAARLSIIFIVYHGDMYNHMEWGRVALHDGLFGIYERPASFWSSSIVNQPPGTIYIFFFIRWLYELLGSLFWFLNNTVPAFPSRLIWIHEQLLYPAMLKMPSILADLGIGYVVYRWARDLTDQKRALLATAIYLFNPITIYNSAWWGQTDATVNLFGLLGFYLLYKKRLFWAIFTFGLALFIKASLIIVLPLFIFSLIKQKFSLKDLLVTTSVVGLIFFVITLPFHPITDLLWLPRVYTGQILFGTLGNMTELAFNIWGLTFGYTPVHADTLIGFIPAKYLGYLIYGLFGVIILYVTNKRYAPETVIWAHILMAFAAFLFLTGIRERYLFPVFPAFAILVALRPKLLFIYIAVSFIHLSNLYFSWSAPHIDFLFHLVKNTVTTTLLTVALLVSYIALFFTFVKNHAK